ncbi:MAG TPA: hypothetical protein P5082_06165 [Treponema sp.]|nr:hypothetical protein [Treponema sp.]
MKHKIILLLTIITTTYFVFGDNRSFFEVYPKPQNLLLQRAISDEGVLLIKENQIGLDALEYIPQINDDLHLETIFQTRNLTFLIESVKVIITPKESVNNSLQAVYFALQNVQTLKGRLYHSYTKNKDIPLFNDAYRIESLQTKKKIPDPQNLQITTIQNEQMFLMLDDANFGKSYYQAEITPMKKGILYTLTNVRSLNFGILPVVGEKKLIVRLYIEPLVEGLLIYSIAGADIPKIISSQVHMPSAIRKRLDVFIDWLVDGLNR